MRECKIPLNVTLPDFDIPIYNSKGKEIGLAVQTKVRRGLFTFQPKLKGKLSRQSYDFDYSYSVNLKGGKIESINLSVKYSM